MSRKNQFKILHTINLFQHKLNCSFLTKTPQGILFRQQLSPNGVKLGSWYTWKFVVLLLTIHLLFISF